ncbi:MAG: hypothetical protein ACO3RV_10220, partial [Luteolibacter sp.]
MAAASFNQSGGDLALTPGNNVGFSISSNSRNVHYTHSGGTITLDGNNSASIVKNAFLGIGNGTGISNTATMTLTDGANLNVGTTVDRSGEIRIASTSESNGTLDVQGGILTVGSASSQNKIYFFKAGASDAPYLARMLQSGGTVITNGIQFGGDVGTYDPTSSAFLHLSGGSLYVGAGGITRGLAADELAVEILLEGGVLGASQSWSSSLDMQIGPQLIIRAQDSVGTGRDVTLSGKISDDGETMGSLVKDGPGMLSLQGANSFRGGLSILNGSVEAKTNSSALGLGGVSMGGQASDGATLLLGNIHANPIMVNSPGSGEVIIAANGPGSGFTLSGAITLNGDLTLKTFDNAINGDFRAVAGITGGVSGNGNLMLDNLGLAANA